MSKLNILNQQQKIIGQEERSVIHRDGLWHQEINIFFYTPKGEIIFQHRAKSKDTWPDRLDATVGGHVEIGSDYDKTAIIETKEETGLDLKISDLESMGAIQRKSVDTESGTTNNTFKTIYIHQYTEPLSKLVPEKGEAIGFESWGVCDLLNIHEEDKAKFIPSVFSSEIIQVFEKIKEKLKK